MQVYIVTESGGSYEEAWKANRFAVLTEDEAKACIAEQLVIHEKRAKELAALEEFSRDYQKTCPMPEYKARIDYPRWPAGTPQKLITAEMREERNQIKEQNRLIDSENAAIHRAWHDEFLSKQAEFARAQGFHVPEYIVFSGYLTPTEWDYEVLEISSFGPKVD